MAVNARKVGPSSTSDSESKSWPSALTTASRLADAGAVTTAPQSDAMPRKYTYGPTTAQSAPPLVGQFFV
ncbi:hypothetical protein ACN28S_33885 [Cystobacter fuscus]